MKYEKIHKGYKSFYWTVIGEEPIKLDGKHPLWLCECCCKNKTQRYVDEYQLKTKGSKSCGCYKQKVIKSQNNFNSITFYQWCKENNRQDLLDRWDYDKNKFKPEELSSQSHRKMHFKCNIHKEHTSEGFIIDNIVKGKSSVKCKQCESFGQWCFDNNRNDLLELWDYEKNDKSPFEIRKTSGKYYFKCKNGKHKSEKHGLSHIISYNSEISCIHCNSFGEYYGEDFLQKYWDYDKNIISPYDIEKSSNKYIWIKCDNEKHGSYKISCNHYFSGRRCPYCAHIKLHIDDSLGKLYSKSFELWSDKNTITPYDLFPHSSKKVYWKCENRKHDDYIRGVGNSVQSEFRCPCCVDEENNSVIQSKTASYLNSLPYTILHENNCTIIPKNPENFRNMPYDNEIKELKLIVEVNGIQHYEESGFHSLQAKRHNTTPTIEFNKGIERDLYKEKYALNNGFEYLVLPYWYFDKEETYKTEIDNKINEILRKVD